MIKYKEGLEITYAALDMLDIRMYLHKDWEIQNIMDNIETYVSSGMMPISFYIYMQGHYDFFKGDVFNYITKEEFMQYCKKRYPDIKWETETIERIYVK